MGIHVHHTKAEKEERRRLEAILIDPTKTEADRDFARERLQAIREAAVGRAKVRAERRADYVEAKPAQESPEELEDLNPAPLRSNFASDEEYREERKWHQLLLDEVAAEGVLADPNASFSKRETAKRLLRKTYKAQHEMCPSISALDGSFLPGTGEGVLATPAPAPVVAVDDRPWGEIYPFKSKHKQGSAAYETELQKWKDTCFMFDAWRAPDILRRKDPVAWEKKKADDLAADRIARPYHYDDLKHLDPCYAGSAHPWKQIEPPAPFIASPLQKQVWGEQSEKFARQRGEAIAEPTTVPAIAPRSYRTAYKILLDGLIVWPWGEIAQSHSLSNVHVFPITAPPGYVSGSGALPQGWQIDEIDMLWRQK
jgi:hypothetical protein